MFSKNDILAQLRAGADAGAIAQKMADEINAAVKEFDEEQEKAKRNTQMRADARHMVEVMAEFFAKHMGEDALSDKELDEATDAVIELSQHLTDLKDVLSGINVKVTKADRAPSAEEEIDDDVLRRFLASL